MGHILKLVMGLGCVRTLQGTRYGGNAITLAYYSSVLISSRAFVWPNALLNCKVTDFGSEKSQSFSEAPDAVQLGDPMNNIFIINLQLGLAMFSMRST